MAVREQFDDELELVRSGLIEMAGLVAAGVALAIQALGVPTSQARDLAKAIRTATRWMEIAIVTRCPRNHRLGAPLASDLRLSISAICITPTSSRSAISRGHRQAERGGGPVSSGGDAALAVRPRWPRRW